MPNVVCSTLRVPRAISVLFWVQYVVLSNDLLSDIKLPAGMCLNFLAFLNSNTA